MTDNSRSSNDPEKRARVHRVVNALIVSSAVGGGLVLTYVSLLAPPEVYYTQEILVAALAALGTSATILLMRYLQSGVIFKQPNPTEKLYESSYTGSDRMDRTLKSHQNQIRDLQSSISDVHNKISGITTANQREFSTEQQAELLSNLKLRLETSATEEFLD